MKRSRWAERSEAGETLIEVLMSAALMALVVVAVIGGISTMLLGSTIHRKQADGNTTLVAAMEQVKSRDLARVCANNTPAHAYRAGYGAFPPLPSTVSIQSIEYQKMVPDAITGEPTVTWTTVLADCLTNPLTMQRIRLQFATPDSSVDSELSFTKGAY